MQSPSELARIGNFDARRPASPAGTAAEVLAPMLAYLALLQLWGRPVLQEELVAAGIATLLSFPGRVPFNRMNSDVASRLAMRWGWLLPMLLALGAVVASGRPLPDAADRYFLSVWGLAAFSAVLVVHMLSPWVMRLSGRLRKRRKVVIVGVNKAAVHLGDAIAHGEIQGQELVGYFDDRGAERAPLPDPGLRLGTLAEVGDFAKRHGVHCVYIALPVSPSPRIVALLQQTHDTTASVYFVPDISMTEVIQCRVALLAGLPMVAVCETPLDGAHGALKRALDVGLTLAAMPLLLPLMALIGLLVRLTSPGPVFFKQRRYGLDGQEIMVWKFRTMTTLEDGSTTYRQATVDDDRITPLGRFLRRTSLDELPQFINVLAGSMSIVGPRPHALAVNEECRKQIPQYMQRHKVKPGITGWAQVNGYRGGDDMASLRKRTECDIQYLKSWSLGLDLLIIWKTALLLVRGDKNAY